MLKRMRIPEDDLKILEKFVQLPSEQQDFILQELTEISPTTPLNIIEKRISNKSDYKFEDIHEFFKFLINFYINFFYFKDSIDNFNEEVIIPSIILHKSKLKLAEQDYENIKLVSAKILSLDKNIGIISKIPYLSEENPNNYMKSHIITDLRYIFYNDPSEIPDYALIKHTFKIDYIKSRKIEEAFYTLNLNDIIELKKNIERAIEKEGSLKELCKKNKINLLKEEDVNGL